MAEERSQWNSRFGFMMAMIGSAVGLGNIWRFPNVIYYNGGGSFLIPYIVALFILGMMLGTLGAPNYIQSLGFTILFAMLFSISLWILFLKKQFTLRGL